MMKKLLYLIVFIMCLMMVNAYPKEIQLGSGTTMEDFVEMNVPGTADFTANYNTNFKNQDKICVLYLYEYSNEETLLANYNEMDVDSYVKKGNIFVYENMEEAVFWNSENTILFLQPELDINTGEPKQHSCDFAFNPLIISYPSNAEKIEIVKEDYTQRRGTGIIKEEALENPESDINPRETDTRSREEFIEDRKKNGATVIVFDEETGEKKRVASNEPGEKSGELKQLEKEFGPIPKVKDAKKSGIYNKIRNFFRGLFSR